MNILKSLLALSLSAVMVGSMALENPVYTPDDSLLQESKVTYQSVWLGSYPQTEIVADATDMTYAVKDSWSLEASDYVADEALFQALSSSRCWKDNELVLSGTKYVRMKQTDALASASKSGAYCWKDDTSWHYYRYDPIKWRVLQVEEDQVLLMTEDILDAVNYNQDGKETTWETSSLRSWLNESFMNRAFLQTEQEAILISEVANTPNVSSGTTSGPDTKDKVFVLASLDIYDPVSSGESETDTSTDAVSGATSTTGSADSNAKAYGMASPSKFCEARLSRSTSYARARGVTWWFRNATYAGNSWWWLRTSGYQADYASCICGHSMVCVGIGQPVGSTYIGVRPVIRIKLENLNQLGQYAGTVANNKEVVQQDYQTSDTRYEDYTEITEPEETEPETEAPKEPETTKPASTVKKTNPIKVSPTTKTYKYTTIKKGAKYFTIKVTSAKGKVTFTSKSKKRVTVSSKGKVTVRKKTPKGTYTIVVKAAGTKTYKSRTKYVKVRIK